MLATLNDYQLKQGMRRLAYSGKPHAPSLPEFVKLCRTVGHADDVPDRPAANVLQLSHDDVFDRWDTAGNNRLLSYVLVAGREGRYFDDRQTRILVALKNRWVHLIRESLVDDEVPAADQTSVWTECMRMAEAEMAREIAA